jgi:glucose/arabinose dehydrogenase
LRCFFILSILLSCTPVYSQSYSKTPLVSNLAWGVSFDIAPDGRIFTTQKGGLPGCEAQISVYDASGNFLSVFYNLNDSVDWQVERGLLGITVDPNFSSNHFVYVFYNYSNTPNAGGDQHIRIQRFTDVANTGTQPTIICDIDVADNYSAGHQGGNIHFRPSDSTHIYITIGDMHTDTLGLARQVDNPYGKILRISKYPGAPPPSDNPFYDDGNPYTGNCDWIWAYGLRNAFEFCFGPNDSLYATENGTTYYDEVNLITKGGFYGWPYCEGNFDADTISLPCHASNSIAPLSTYPFPLPSLTGIIFYTDSVFSNRQNHLIVGDFNHADLQDVTLGNAPAYDVVVADSFWLDESNICGITSLHQGPEGCIYVMEIGDSIFGGIYMICPDANSVHENSSNPHLQLAGQNPFTDETFLSYNLPDAQHVSIVLYDAWGRAVAEITNERMTPGSHEVTINASKYALSAGIYTCILQTETSSSYLQLVVH